MNISINTCPVCIKDNAYNQEACVRCGHRREFHTTPEGDKSYTNRIKVEQQKWQAKLDQKRREEEASFRKQQEDRKRKENERLAQEIEQHFILLHKHEGVQRRDDSLAWLHNSISKVEDQRKRLEYEKRLKDEEQLPPPVQKSQTTQTYTSSSMQNQNPAPTSAPQQHPAPMPVPPCTPNQNQAPTSTPQQQPVLRPTPIFTPNHNPASPSNSTQRSFAEIVKVPTPDPVYVTVPYEPQKSTLATGVIGTCLFLPLVILQCIGLFSFLGFSFWSILLAINIIASMTGVYPIINHLFEEMSDALSSWRVIRSLLFSLSPLFLLLSVWSAMGACSYLFSWSIEMIKTVGLLVLILCNLLVVLSYIDHNIIFRTISASALLFVLLADASAYFHGNTAYYKAFFSMVANQNTEVHFEGETTDRIIRQSLKVSPDQVLYSHDLLFVTGLAVDGSEGFKLNDLSAFPLLEKLDMTNAKDFNIDLTTFPMELELCISGNGRLLNKDGCVYEGDFEKYQCNGHGMITFKNGDFNGKGVFIWSDGTRYEGDFLDDKITGSGTKLWADGAVYKGGFLDGAYHGKGILALSSGAKYEGDFIDGRCNGKGAFIWPDGTRYEGDFLDDKMTGTGTKHWADGAVYKGGFLDGIYHGYGVLTYGNGEKYEGDFANNLYDGKGIYCWPDGSRYEGEFVDGAKTGKGVYIWPTGDRYEGNFIDTVKTGKGVYVWPDGTRYEGDFLDDKITGTGTKHWADGAVYKGDFLDGVYHGYGILTLADGTRQEGRFVDGVYKGD